MAWCNAEIILVKYLHIPIVGLYLCTSWIISEYVTLTQVHGRRQEYDTNSMTVCMQTHENSNNTMVTVTQRSLGSCRNKKLAVDSSFLLHTRYAWITACSGKPSVFSCYGACMYVSVQKVIHLNVMYMEHFHVTSHVQKWPPFCYTAAIQQWSYTAPLHSCRSKFSY